MIFVTAFSIIIIVLLSFVDSIPFLQDLPSYVILTLKTFAFLIFGFSATSAAIGRPTKLMNRVSKFNNFKSIDWREFEHLVGEYYQSKGYSVTVMGGSGGDGGIDLLIKKSFKKYIVQCKHWKGSVGVSIIREMYGVMHAEDADGVIIVCSNRFTKEAKAFASGKPIRLLDGHSFLNMIKEAQ
ncbi:restriction endonuclease [Vibrio harveyi]|uniref:restriction endonuclease n=1 Tax=Vibrio harveyi TaxID=669 RepID=UPI003CF61FA8